MSNVLDRKDFNFDFLWVFRGFMVKTIKMEHCFDSEGWNIKDDAQNGRQLGS